MVIFLQAYLCTLRLCFCILYSFNTFNNTIRKLRKTWCLWMDQTADCRTNAGRSFIIKSVFRETLFTVFCYWPCLHSPTHKDVHMGAYAYNYWWHQHTYNLPGILSLHVIVDHLAICWATAFDSKWYLVKKQPNKPQMLWLLSSRCVLDLDNHAGLSFWFFLYEFIQKSSVCV